MRVDADGYFPFMADPKLDCESLAVTIRPKNAREFFDIQRFSKRRIHAAGDELQELLVPDLLKAGAAELMTPESIATLAVHAQSNPRG